MYSAFAQADTVTNSIARTSSRRCARLENVLVAADGINEEEPFYEGCIADCVVVGRCFSYERSSAVSSESAPPFASIQQAETPLTKFTPEQLRKIKLEGVALPKLRAASKTLYDDRLKKISADLQTKVEKGELASVNIGVIKDGKIIWKESFGLADKERNIKADSKTIYALASLSKSITATGLWVLVERGKLNINDAVEKHLKSVKLSYFQGKPSDLKIRHLLAMEGGIPHQFEYFYDVDKERRPSLAEQIRRYGLVVAQAWRGPPLFEFFDGDSRPDH